MIDELDPPEQLLRLPPKAGGKSSKSRLASAEDAQSLTSRVLQEDQVRSYFRAVVKGCYDGNAPYNQKKLVRDGNGWCANLNFLGLESILDSARVPYYALFSAVPEFAVFKTRYQQDNPESERWNKVIAQKFSCMLNGWKQFRWHVQSMQFEMLFEGWGPVMWEDDDDWRFRSVPARSVLVPQGSNSCLDDRIPFVVVRCPYRIHELYNKIENEKAATEVGWNVEAVQYAIRYGTKGNGTSTSWKDQPWEVWQKKFKNHELTTSYTESDIINCAHVFVQEFDGKVSHFIITEDPQVAGKKNTNGFLYKHANRFESYDQAMVVAFQNTGDGSWHSVRGIGLKSFKYEEVRNRLNNRIIDNAFLSSGMVLEADSAKSNDKLQLMVNGMISFIPPGTKVSQATWSGQIEGALAVSRYLENQLNNKVGHFSRNPSRDDGRGEQPTATQINQQAQNDTRLTSGQIDNHYGDLDCIYDECFRRAKTSSQKLAKRFVQDCLDAGVPREALDDMEYVRANRLSGYGSPQMRKQAMQEIGVVVQMLPEDGKNNYLNDYIAAAAGPDKVLAYNPPQQKPDIDESMATLENTTLHTGVNPPVISGMDHVVHLQIHLADADQSLAPLEQAVDADQPVDQNALMQAYQYIQALGPHTEEHLMEIMNDKSRSQLAKLFTEQIANLVAFHGKLRSAIREAQHQAEQQAMEEQQATALGALDQAKLASAQNDMEIKRAKAAKDIQIKQEKAKAAEVTSAYKTRSQVALNTAKTVSDIQLARAKEQSKPKSTKK